MTEGMPEGGREPGAAGTPPPLGGAPGGTRGFEKINLLYHLIIGLAVGIVAAFTALAWPVAMLVGYIVGRDQVERAQGVKARAAVNMLRALLIVIGVGAMLFLGALIGGLIALLIVALVAFSERIAANTSPADQGIARILMAIVAVGTWLVLLYLLKPNVNISIG